MNDCYEVMATSYQSMLQIVYVDSKKKLFHRALDQYPIHVRNDKINSIDRFVYAAAVPWCILVLPLDYLFPLPVEIVDVFVYRDVSWTVQYHRQFAW